MRKLIEPRDAVSKEDQGSERHEAASNGGLFSKAIRQADGIDEKV